MKKLYFLLILVEFQALKVFYNATGGNLWKDNSGWQNINTTATANDVTSSWKGVTVENGHVTEIGMSGNNLVGYLPSAIGNLTWLKYLGTDNCKLEGAIPHEFGNLVNLEGINLSRNRFTSLPASMSKLVKLKYVYLTDNPLNCPYPADLIKNWPELGIFYGMQCGFTGNLPDLFNNNPKLYIFNVSGNQLTGEIPASLSKIKTLYTLDLSGNTFSGNLPPLDSCRALQDIVLATNNLSGAIPASWAGLASLRTLMIDGNTLSGVIPAGLFNTPLANLYAFRNFFTFEGIEPNIVKIKGLQNKSYGTDKLFPLKQNSLAVNSGESMALNAAALSVYGLGGNNNRYKWFRNDTEVYSGNDPSYSVSSAGTAQAGIYRFEVTNTVVTDLTLKSENITVSVLVAGNQAPTDIKLSSLSVNENFTGTVGTLSATDGDTGDTHNFSLATGNGANDKDNAHFSISGNDLVMKSGADYEAKQILYLLVTANDLHTVLLLLAKDPEGAPVTYAIPQGNESGAFAITGNKLVVADNTKLKYDTQNQYTLKVSASDGSLSSTIELVVSLSKINKMPVVANATFTIPENTSTGTLVGSVTGSDPEGATLVYSIISGNPDNAFRISGNQIIVNNAIAVDYDTRTSFSLIVNATDGISNVQATITINLTNLVDETGNDILSFTIPGLVEPVVIDALTHTIKARVEDVSLGALKADFRLSKGASSNPASGTVFNFAAPFTVRVTSEKGVSADWQIRVTIPSPVRNHDGFFVKVYPNPVTDYLHISGLQGTTTLRLVDLGGRMVQTIFTDSSSEMILLSDQKPGLYLLSVESALGRSIHKIIRK